MQIISDTQLDFCDVLIRPQSSSLNHRSEVETERNFKKFCLNACPIMNANMTQTGTFDVAKKMVENKMFGTFHKFYTAEQIKNFFEENQSCSLYFITIGLRNKDEEIKRLKELNDYHFSILIDVPNAYIPEVENYVKEVRAEFPHRIIAVGNVCTGDITQQLIKAGADIIKVGIGPSAVCRTRHTTGCGRPQLSAIIECANSAHQVGGYIIADGGFVNIGDFCKAFVAGADICMSGCFFAGCDEAAGEIITKIYETNEFTGTWVDNQGYYHSTEDGVDKDTFVGLTEKQRKHEIKYFKEYYGMSSFRAQEENYGQRTKFGTSEGVESKLVPYVGPIQSIINDIKGGIRSTGTYIGAKNVKNFSRQGSFYKINRIQ